MIAKSRILKVLRIDSIGSEKFVYKAQIKDRMFSIFGIDVFSPWGDVCSANGLGPTHYYESKEAAQKDLTEILRRRTEHKVIGEV